MGVYLAINKNNKRQIEYMTQKGIEFSDHIRTGKLTRGKAWYAVEETTMKTPEYPMEAIGLNEDNWYSIMSPILKYVVPVLRYNRKFPREVIYTPRKIFRLNVIHLWHNQYLTQIITVLEQTSKDKITSNLIKALTEEMRLQLRLPGDLSNRD